MNRSGLGEFFLSSDAMMPSFTTWKKMKPIIDECPEPEREAFIAKTYTMGGLPMLRRMIVICPTCVAVCTPLAKWIASHVCEP